MTLRLYDNRYFFMLQSSSQCQMGQLSILQTATINPSRYFGFKDLGLVNEKYMADLVVLHKNPPEDIEHFKSVHAVIKSGNFIGQNEIETGLKNIRNHHMNPKKEVEPMKTCTDLHFKLTSETIF